MTTPSQPPDPPSSSEPGSSGYDPEPSDLEDRESLSFLSGNREEREGGEEDIDVGEEDGEEGSPSSPVFARPRTFFRFEFLYQAPFKEAVGRTVAFSIWNGSEEQIYYREAKVGESWQQLDAGWFRDTTQEVRDEKTGKTVSVPLPVTLLLINEEGLAPGRNPTAEEIEALSGRVIEVGYAMSVPVPIPSPSPAPTSREERRGTRTMWDDPAPSPPSPAESSSRSMIVVQEAFAWVPPGEPFQINPVCLSRLYLRCVKGVARYSVRVIPR